MVIFSEITEKNALEELMRYRTRKRQFIVCSLRGHISNSWALVI